MIENVQNNQNVSFGRRYNPVKAIVDSSAAKANAEQILGIKHANINYSKKELETLGVQNKIINLESKLDVATERGLIAHLKKQIAQEKQKLNLFA
ncbi:MAG: hypothetical protein A2039_06490 [Candidatus Melainabacteria bacterium GWA2_34_9]|nr:MAG: hypothetical protein A2039_06490 [Candidatus Melainabacteria bacterium GWA2_34_9]